MKNINVLHISTADNVGGSGRSAYKVHNGLRKLGFNSKMIVSQKITADPDIDLIGKKGMKIADRLSGLLFDFFSLQYLYFPSSYKLLSHPWFIDADIIQLYNTHGNYFSHTVLPYMARKKKKIVWRLSDMWPVTGHCAYSGDCTLWLTGCKKCPSLGSYPSLKTDTASFLWSLKKKIYNKLDMSIVAPSSWTFEIAGKSPLFENLKKTIIPNGVDINIFKPISKEWTRTILNIPITSKIVLFLAHSIKDNPRKGGDFFIKAVNSLKEGGLDNLGVMLVGYGAEDWGHEIKCNVYRHGLINEDTMLSLIYNSADVIVHPAVLENMPNGIIEAMACGTPAVAFNTGGVSDVVKHMETGILADYGNLDGLTNGIKQILCDDNLRSEMNRKCRELAEKEFSVELQAMRFAQLYREVVGS